MKVISIRDVEQIGVKSLGLDYPHYDFSHEETLAALLRRCGAFKCPCPPTTLIRSVLTLLSGVRDDQEARDLLSDLLDQMISYGDFVESKEVSGHSNARLLYIAPPAFVEVSPQRFLILGLAADDTPVIPTDLARTVEHLGHSRVLKTPDGSSTRARLIAAGFTEISSEEWLKAPEPRSAESHLQRYVALLSKSQRPGTAEELLVLNTESPVRYYPVRWEGPKRKSGSYVARRQQMYGAALWSFVELAEGKLIRLVDLPALETKWKACDEAWHLQQAIDASAGHPQLYRVRDESDGSVVVDLFSPIPSWAQRRWDYVGRRATRQRSLLAYRFDPSALEAELKFARQRLWLSDLVQREA